MPSRDLVATINAREWWWEFSTNFTPNDSTGIPTQDPFVWDNGKMTDLGNLGGTFAFGQCTNNRRDVIGQASLPGDLVTHAFVWRKGQDERSGDAGGR